jgi:DNA-binding LytR/AlgR family response regulator
MSSRLPWGPSQPDVRARIRTRNGDPSVCLFLVGEREHRLYPLYPEQIDYVRSSGNYVQYSASGSQYIARESIAHLGDALRPYGFIRIERSILLNLRAIAYAEPSGRGVFAFTLTSRECLYSTSTYREAILEVLPFRRRMTPTRGVRALRGGTSDDPLPRHAILQ